MEYIANLKKHNSQLQRVSLFGRKMDDDTLEVTEFFCSVDDSYSKKLAHEEFQRIHTTFYDNVAKDDDFVGVKPLFTNYKVFTLPLEAHSPKFTLNKYANENYFNLVTQVIKWEKADDKHITKLEFNPHKKTLIAKTLSK